MSTIKDRIINPIAYAIGQHELTVDRCIELISQGYEVIKAEEKFYKILQQGQKKYHIKDTEKGVK